MKAYTYPGFFSFATDKVERYLNRHRPIGVEITEDMAEADFVVVHVVGRRDRIRSLTQKLLAQGKRYAVIQYTLRSCKTPNTADWMEIWNKASVVWSYLDLEELCDEDGIGNDFDFYYAPLGVDPDIFYPQPLPKTFMICTGGGLYTTESTRECYKAAKAVDAIIANLGPDVGRDISWFTHLTDRDVADLYNRCNYVAGLRRTEGFELGAAEGICCGIRPILFDRPHYRVWHSKWGIFIPEASRAEVIDHLIEIFKQTPEPVTAEEIGLAVETFDWQRIINTFWEVALGHA